MSFVSNIKNVKRTGLILQIQVSETEISAFCGGISKFQMSRFVFQNTPQNFLELDRFSAIHQNLSCVYNLRREKSDSPKTRMAITVQSEQPMHTN
jgi:hypothetical protein